MYCSVWECCGWRHRDTGITVKWMYTCVRGSWVKVKLEEYADLPPSMSSPPSPPSPLSVVPGVFGNSLDYCFELIHHMLIQALQCPHTEVRPNSKPRPLSSHLIGHRKFNNVPYTAKFFVGIFFACWARRTLYEIKFVHVAKISPLDQSQGCKNLAPHYTTSFSPMKKPWVDPM